MEDIKEVTTEQPKKLSYEELNNAANQLAGQYDRLLQENQALRSQFAIAKIEFLFRIVQFKENFDEETLAKAVAEIKEGLFPTVEVTPIVEG